ncbi:16S rRNA (adenine(1518)-N(6)/adenine(1519)-N(6))-dimethyltransferase RsmA [Mycoplasmopsis adleri]|uniref:16S rRNA (adenine(1518)-N(6)/adenine(1519)-N(6))- dimethyltransferase RsmA n=1 Tax=Mycoplasmopsis adleri TaxID=51362 RepID=UPI003872C038
MSQENIRAKKKFGQNFLNNQGIIKKIVNIINPTNKKIIEIGPGMGALTEHLIPAADEFVAFEIDTDMIQILNAKNWFNDETKKIIQGDFLEADLNSFGGFEVCGNIPYYITSDIIMKLLDYRFLFKRATLMVQDEVANRLVAKPNSKEYSKLTVTCQYVAKVTKELFVGKNNFTPIPKVDSAIVSLEFYQDKQDNFENIKNFLKLCFANRRKKLTWSLKQNYDKELITSAYSTMNIDDNTRAEQLTLDQLVKLYNLLNKL